MCFKKQCGEFYYPKATLLGNNWNTNGERFKPRIVEDLKKTKIYTL